MPTPTPVYGTATTVTITLASLATSAADVGRESGVIDVATLDVLDMWVGGKITVGTTPTANTQIRIYFAPSHDGTLYAGNAAGAGDAALTPSAVELMKLAEIIPVKVATSNVTFNWGVLASRVFGGFLPPKFVVFVTHNTVAALNATGGNHSLSYRAVGPETP